MPYTMAGRNLMLNALKGTTPATPITHVGLLQDDSAIVGVTGVTSSDTFTKTSHGLSNGNLVFLSSLTGGTSLVVGRPYYVVGVAGNNFQLAHVSGGSAVDLGTDVTTVIVTRSVELSGGSYARVAITYAAAADGQIDDTANGTDIVVTSGSTVHRVGYYSASTAGTLLAITTQTPEGPYGAAGIYRVTDSKHQLNATGGS